MITGHKLSLSFKSIPVFNALSFSLLEGRTTIFIGRSGAGKTTLLRCIANLQRNYEGFIAYGNSDLRKLSQVKRAKMLGYVFQQFHLFPHLTVFENCALALQEPSDRVDLVHATLENLGMGSYLNSLPSQLSGGQQQRVAIARALVLQPKVLLLDEPTSALDPESKKGLEEVLAKLREEGVTLVLSSHDIPFIKRMKDRVYFLEEGQVVEEWDSRRGPCLSKGKIQQFLEE